MPSPLEPSPSRRLVLHIGLHKTGTTYLQGLWRANRAQLASQGVYYPGAEGEPVQRSAVWDLLGRRPRGVDDKRLPGQWQALTTAVAHSEQPVTLVSEEALSLSTAKQAAATVAGFPGHEVHVLVTCRDLGRVLVSAWQEDVKNDLQLTWREFASAVKDPERRAQNPARGFWRAQDLSAVLATWRGVVPADRIHVVTVPPPAAQREELLSRVAAVVGFDPAVLTEPGRWDNSSLGVAGIEVVRRLNARLDHRLNQRQHSHVVNGVIVPYLVRTSTDTKFVLPEDELGWVEAEARRQVAAVREGGYGVTGDLEDLVPGPESTSRTREEPTAEELLDVALVALSGLAEAHARLWWRRRKDEQPPDELPPRRVRVASAARSASYRTKKAAAGLADRNRHVARALGAYLAAQERRRSRRTPP